MDNLIDLELDSSKSSMECENEYKCNFPKELCEKLREKDGQNKKIIEESTGVKIFLKDNPDSQEFKLCLIKGDQVQIACALSMISSDKRFSNVNLQPVDIMPQRPHHSGITNPFVLSENTQKDSPMKTGLLSSIESVFEHNRQEDERRKQNMNRKREAELEHSRYLKNTASPQELAEANFVIKQWTNKHSSRQMSAISKKVADRRRQTSNPYSRPNSNKESRSNVISSVKSRFGTSLYTTTENKRENNNAGKLENPEQHLGANSVALSNSRNHPMIDFSDDDDDDIVINNGDALSNSRNHPIIDFSDDDADDIVINNGDSVINISETCIIDNSNFLCGESRDNDFEGKQLSNEQQKEENTYVKCPILNCNCKFNSRSEFQSHMDKHEHSPNNPWSAFSGDGEEYMALCHDENMALCPECGKLFQSISKCKQHIEDEKHKHIFCPLPVIGFLCGQCLCVFPTQICCQSHIEKWNHQQLAFPFSDDIGKTYTDGIPISKNFFQDYYKRCMTSDYHIVCCDCELVINSPKELQQHYDETKLTHHCMAMTEMTKSDIFTSYFCTHLCSTCHASVENPKQNGGYHCCSKNNFGKIIIDGCKTFRSLVLGQCIRLQHDEIRVASGDPI